MPISDNSLVVALIGFALYLVSAVALYCLDKAISDTHDNAGVVCGAVIVAVFEEYLVTYSWSLAKSSSLFVVLECKAATRAQIATNT